MSERDELTAEEKRALEGLASGPEPPPSLEEAVVSRLAARGLLRRRRRAWVAWALAVAAGVALFVAGLAVGARRGAPPAAAVEAMPRYLLLLYDAPDEAGLTGEQMAARVAEYRDWAISLRRQGNDLGGEKLASASLDLGPEGATPGPLPLGGYFVFSAKDDATALTIARSCPHLRHGGRAELRPIEKT
jgi:hypothetical protein